MIVRIVKMTFKPGQQQVFTKLFAGWKQQIAAFPGCTHLELWQSEEDERVFFTYSHWDRQEDLEAYRNSPLFAEVWPTVKDLFAAQPEAWSHESPGT